MQNLCTQMKKLMSHQITSYHFLADQDMTWQHRYHTEKTRLQMELPPLTPKVRCSLMKDYIVCVQVSVTFVLVGCCGTLACVVVCGNSTFGDVVHGCLMEFCQGTKKLPSYRTTARRAYWITAACSSCRTSFNSARVDKSGRDEAQFQVHVWDVHLS